VNSVRDGEGDFGYNARTEVFENLFEAGVIDPTKVTRVALENAVSISGMVLITECVVSDEEEEMPAVAPPAGMGGGMGGMM
jgi:chaperonin GroEL